MRRCSFLSRKIFLACHLATFSGPAPVLPPAHCSGYLREFDFRNIYAGMKFCVDQKGRVVIHLAEQELALSAIRRLDLAVRKFKRAKKSDIELVVRGSLKNMFVKDEDCIFLIRCCGSLLANESLEVRRVMAKAVWNRICNSSILLDNNHFVGILKTHLENQNPVCPKQFLSEMKKFGVDPNEETLRMLLYSVNVFGKSEENVTYVMDELKAKGFTTGSECDGTFASILAEQGKVLEAEDIMSSMKKRRLGIASGVYVSLMKGYIMQGKKDSVLDLLVQMEKIGMKLSSTEYTSVATKLAEVSSLPESKYRDLIKSVMPSMGIPKDEDVHYCLWNAIQELLHCGKGQVACCLLMNLPRPLLQLAVNFEEPLPLAFFGELVRAPIAQDEVLTICDQMEDFMIALSNGDGYLKPFVLHAVTGRAFQAAESKLCLFLLETLALRGAPLRPHYFWPLLISAAAKQENEEMREERVFEVLKKMISLGVMVDRETLTVYVLPFIRPRKDGFEMLTRLRQSGGVFDSPVSRTAVIMWLLDEGDLTEAARFNGIHQGEIDPLPLVEPLVRCVMSKWNQPHGSSLSSLIQMLKGLSDKQARNIDSVGHFLLELSEKLGLFELSDVVHEHQARSMDYLLRILKALDVNGIRISSRAVDTLLNLLSPQLELSEAGVVRRLEMPPVDAKLNLPSHELQPIPHPRDMDMSELEAHLIELRAKGLNDRGVLRRLFQLHCRQKNAKRALEIKRDLDLAGHSFSPGMLSSLLHLLTHCNELEKAEGVLLQLKNDHPKFKLDDHKVVDVAALMCRRGRVNEGIELLQWHARGTKVQPGRAIERNLVELVLAVQQGGADAEGGRQWTPGDLLAELTRLGYVSSPPPASLVSKWKQISG